MELFRIPINYGQYLLMVMHIMDVHMARYPENVTSLPFLTFALLNSLTPEMFSEVYEQIKKFNLFVSLAVVFDYGAIPQKVGDEVSVVVPRDDRVLEHLDALGFSYSLSLDVIKVFATPIAATRIARVANLLKRYVIESMKKHKLLPLEVGLPLVQL